MKVLSSLIPLRLSLSYQTEIRSCQGYKECWKIPQPLATEDERETVPLIFWVLSWHLEQQDWICVSDREDAFCTWRHVGMVWSQGGITNMMQRSTCCIRIKAQQVLQLMPFIQLKQLEGILGPWREENNSPVRKCHWKMLHVVMGDCQSWIHFYLPWFLMDDNNNVEIWYYHGQAFVTSVHQRMAFWRIFSSLSSFADQT